MKTLLQVHRNALWSGKALCAFFVVGVLSVLALQTPALAQGPKGARTATGTGITYQGYLKVGGNAVSATCSFDFGLWDAASGGAQVGGTVTRTQSLAVSNGVFTSNAIDFGASAFEGSARYLGVAVNCPGDSSATSLGRQTLTPAPYALFALGAGTADSSPFALRANNVVGWQLVPSGSNVPNVVGGYNGNSVTSGVYAATISGGGLSSDLNRVTDSYGVIGGGRGNRAGDDAGSTLDHGYATVGGGWNNTASGNTSTVAGGYSNTASGLTSTIGGGQDNTAEANYTTVAGGDTNHATSNNATVSGGNANTASGAASTVAGGNANTASSTHGTVGGGYHNAASGMNSTVPGGSYATATHYGEMAYASGFMDALGDAQTSTYVLRHTTADGAMQELFLDGAGDSQRLTIASGRSIAYDILVVGRSSTGSTGAYQLRGMAKNVSGTISATLSPAILGEDVASWDATTMADSPNDALGIWVQGAAATDIKWVATVRTVEVSH